MFVLVRVEGKASISEKRFKSDWATGKAWCVLVFDLLSTVRGLKVGL